jgi:hypothetical protein
MSNINNTTTNNKSTINQQRSNKQQQQQQQQQQQHETTIFDTAAVAGDFSSLWLVVVSFFGFRLLLLRLFSHSVLFFAIAISVSVLLTFVDG